MWAGLALVTIPLTLSAGDDADVKKELKALEGTWNIVLEGTPGGVRETIPKYLQPAFITFNCRADGSAMVEQALPEGPTKTTVTLDLSKTAAGWRIADIHWAGQSDSLVTLLTKKN